jgi:hypothetical protein
LIVNGRYKNKKINILRMWRKLVGLGNSSTSKRNR